MNWGREGGMKGRERGTEEWGGGGNGGKGEGEGENERETGKMRGRE